MTCKLCREEKGLKNSHIIPEFVYSSLYDDKHRFYEISTNADKKNKLPQKGVRERLLCEDCEQHLSKYERYVSLILNGAYWLEVRKNGRHIHMKGFEYSKFKLFSLSVLWRAGVSGLPFFEQVELGKHEKTIREMIVNGDPGEQYNYPFILSPIVHEDVVQEAMIVKPTWSRVAGHYAYRFVFGGIAWVFVVSSHKAPKEIVQASISKDGELTMLPWKLSDMKFIVNMAKDLVSLGKL